MTNRAEFDRLVSAAWNQPFTGWDFSYLQGRIQEEPLSWDYRQLAQTEIGRSQSMLDMDTGGGELLAGLSPLPEHTCATEDYPPNIPIAAARLAPLGVKVFQTSPPDSLPFPDQTFDLVLNRHGSFSASEVRRVLQPGGCFITQQVGGRDHYLINEAFEDPTGFPYAFWTLENALGKLEQAGLKVVQTHEEFPRMAFLDIGALVYYLKVISWQVEDFTPTRYADRLWKIHTEIQITGAFESLQHRFLIVCKVPSQ